MESPQRPDQPQDDEPGAPAPPAGPQAPASPQAPAAPSYGGPVPPGGWEQPIARPQGFGGAPLAGWGSRFGAWFIDGLIVGVPATIVFLALVGGAVGVGDDNAGFWVLVGSSLLSILVFAVLALIYAPVTMARPGPHNGQTWGKQILGIRVIRDSGEPMTFWWAALREVAVKNLGVGIAASATFGLAFLVNYLWPLWDDQNRALHDMAVSTHVVRA